MADTVSSVRAYAYLAGVLQNQQRDRFCGKCKAFVNSVTSVREHIARFENEHGRSGLDHTFSEAKSSLESIVLPQDVPGQKKAGNCLLPQGACFVKSSLRILELL